MSVQETLEPGVCFRWIKEIAVINLFGSSRFASWVAVGLGPSVCRSAHPQRVIGKCN